MGELDTDTIGLIVIAVAVFAVFVAGKLQDRHRKKRPLPGSCCT